MTEHTKTPWAVKGQSVFDTTEHQVSLAYCGIVAGAGVCKDGKVRSFGTTEDQARANAAFIVKAVNNHDALVKALRDLEEANDKLAALRSQEMYIAMLDAGQEFALADLQDARNEAKRILAHVSGTKESGK